MALSLGDRMGDPLGVSRRLWERLGKVVARWSYLEQELAELLAYLCRADPGAMYVISQNVSASTVANWNRVLLNTIPSHALESEILAALKDIDAIRAERNAYIHGLWQPGPSDATATVQTVRWDRPEVVKNELVTIGDLENLLESIDEAYSQLITIGARCGYRKL